MGRLIMWPSLITDGNSNRASALRISPLPFSRVSALPLSSRTTRAPHVADVQGFVVLVKNQDGLVNRYRASHSLRWTPNWAATGVGGILTHRSACPATTPGPPTMTTSQTPPMPSAASRIAGPMGTQIDPRHSHRSYQQDEDDLGHPSRNGIASPFARQDYRQPTEAHDGEHDVSAGESVSSEFFVDINEGWVGAGACDYTLNDPVGSCTRRHEGPRISPRRTCGPIRTGLYLGTP